MNKLAFLSFAVAFAFSNQVFSNNNNDWRPSDSQIRGVLSGHAFDQYDATANWLKQNVLSILPFLVSNMEKHDDALEITVTSSIIRDAAIGNDPRRVIETLLDLSSALQVHLCAASIALEANLMTEDLWETVLQTLNPEYDNSHLQSWALHLLDKAAKNKPGPVMDLIRRSPSPTTVLTASRALLRMTEGEIPDAWKKEITDRLFDFLLNASPDGVQHKNGAAELLALLGDSAVLTRWTDELPKIKEAERQRTQEDIRLLLSLTESQTFDEQTQGYFDQELEETTIYRRIEGQFQELKNRLAQESPSRRNARPQQ